MGKTRPRHWPGSSSPWEQLASFSSGWILLNLCATSRHRDTAGESLLWPHSSHPSCALSLTPLRSHSSQEMGFQSPCSCLGVLGQFDSFTGTQITSLSTSPLPWPAPVACKHLSYALRFPPPSPYSRCPALLCR